MSEKAFISFLQQLLTMLDKNDPSSVDTARSALSSLVSLAEASGKADGVTLMYVVHFDAVYLCKRSIYLVMAIIGLANWSKLQRTRNPDNE